MTQLLALCLPNMLQDKTMNCVQVFLVFSFWFTGFVPFLSLEVV